MSLIVSFIGELPARIGNEPVCVSAWCAESVFGVGEEGIAYRDTRRQVRISPRWMITDFDAVVRRVVRLGNGKWTDADVRSGLQAAHQNLLNHFEVDHHHFGDVLSVAKGHRARLKEDPNVEATISIPKEGLEDLGAQNGQEDESEARQILIRDAMVRLANHVSRVSG